jgi:hypothetical protein
MRLIFTEGLIAEFGFYVLLPDKIRPKMKKTKTLILFRHKKIDRIIDAGPPSDPASYKSFTRSIARRV